MRRKSQFKTAIIEHNIREISMAAPAAIRFFSEKVHYRFSSGSRLAVPQGLPDQTVPLSRHRVGRCQVGGYCTAIKAPWRQFMRVKAPFEIILQHVIIVYCKRKIGSQIKFRGYWFDNLT